VATIAEAPPREGAARRLSAFLFRHRWLKLALSLGGPLTWFLVIYLGSLALLLFAAFWHLDVFTAEIVRGFSLSNFRTLLDVDVYRTIALRTVGISVAVTLTDLVLSFPLAYYAARMATPRMRNALLIAVVLPLGRTTSSGSSRGS
jgi:putative spermidine/putrescine transport system permease protein